MTKLDCLVISALSKLNTRTPSYSQMCEVAKELKADFDYGATRWVLIFKKHKIVYKIPRFETNKVDYCDIEFQKYQSALKYRVERCLLPINYVGQAGEIPVYTQPMYSFSVEDRPWGYDQYINEKTKDLGTRPIMRKIRRGFAFSTPNAYWLARATQIYGKAFMRSLQEWANDNRVNDLHNANIGFLKEQPVIIDYAGYHN